MANPDLSKYTNNRADAKLCEAAPELLEALIRAERKLRAYVGVCKDDKELNKTILPMCQNAIAKAEGGAR